MKFFILYFCFIACSYKVLSQELMNFNNGCSFSGEKFQSQVYSFDSDAEAEAALKRIMSYTGLPQNFVIKAANVDNAQACILGKIRYILYSQLFMIRVKNQTHTDWAAISILAHEIGHHLSGHTLDSAGSRPTIELEADRFSGFILAKMGATLDEALIAMQKLASENGSSTHPPRSARIAAITNGWQASKQADSNSSSNMPSNNPAPSETTPKKSNAGCDDNTGSITIINKSETPLLFLTSNSVVTPGIDNTKYEQVTIEGGDRGSIPGLTAGYYNVCGTYNRKTYKACLYNRKVEVKGCKETLIVVDIHPFAPPMNIE